MKLKPNLINLCQLTKSVLCTLFSTCFLNSLNLKIKSDWEKSDIFRHRKPKLQGAPEYQVAVTKLLQLLVASSNRLSLIKYYFDANKEDVLTYREN